MGVASELPPEGRIEAKPASGPARMGAEAGGMGDDAIRALGSLFRLTEVFLWDDASGGISKSSTCHNSSPEEDSAGYASSAVSSSYIDSVQDDATSAEDLELARQMDALGLPASFKTNKEGRNTSTGGKRRGMLTKTTSVFKVTGVQVPDMSRWPEVIARMSSQVSDGTRTASHTCAAIQAESDASHFGTDDIFNQAVHSDGVPNNQDVAIPEKIVKEQICTEIVDMVTDSTICDPPRINTKHNTEAGITVVDFRCTKRQENAVENVGHMCFQDENLNLERGKDINLEDTSSLCCVIQFEETSIDSNPAKCFCDRSKFDSAGEWGVFWDAFYMRSYYYNFLTQESTWYRPSGLEQSALSFTSNEINSDVTEESAYLAFAWDNDNRQGAVEVTGPSQEVQNDGKMPTDVTEEGTYLAVAWDDHNHQGAVKATSPSVEVQNDGEVSGQTSHEVVPRVDSASQSLTSDMDLSFLAGSSKNLDEHVDHINCTRTSASAKDFCEVPFCPSDAMDHLDRLSNASHDMGAEENWVCDSQQGDMVSVSNDLYHCHHVMNHNRKKKVKIFKSNHKKLSCEGKGHSLPETVEGLPSSLFKYWYQRYSLFSKFDHGVKVDEEGWFSVTPEALARHHASRCGHGTVVDCFAGIGGNAIQFAMKSDHVIAIDIDPQKVDYAQHNATIYGVGSNIDFIKGDFFILALQLKADTVFMSPPWGGPDYARVQIYDIRSMLKPHDGYFLFETAMKIASTVVMFLPRNVDQNQLAELSLLAHPPWELEVERNYLNGKLKGITAYFRQPSNKSQEIPSDLDL